MSDEPDPNDEREAMVIADPGERSWWGFTAWLLCYLVVAGVLVALFVRFTASLAWAVGLVGFMLAYMTIVARWTGGNAERRRE